ncbi:MAG: LON peptidase substrate-binding domain-containing protein [Magnetospiraceae bacterium]
MSTGLLTDLPETIPIFPLSGVVLMPAAQLPLNIFEPRYLELVADALAGDRFIGIIQPQAVHPDPVPPDAPILAVGCAGMITSNSEEGKGPLIIILRGICRFRIVQEIDVDTAYRQATVSYEPFRADLADLGAGTVPDRGRLLTALTGYLERIGAHTHVEGIDTVDDLTLVTSLVMSLPLDRREKQAILEAKDLARQGALLTGFLEMTATAGGGYDGSLQ